MFSFGFLYDDTELRESFKLLIVGLVVGEISGKEIETYLNTLQPRAAFEDKDRLDPVNSGPPLRARCLCMWFVKFSGGAI